MAFIRGKRVYLRAIEADEWEHGYRWINDPEVARHLMGYYPYSRLAEREWYENAAGGKSNREQHLAIVLNENDKYIGNLSLMNMDWRDRHAEIGIMVGEKEYWGHGYGTEALRLLLKWGFEELGFHRLYLRVHEENTRAQRVYEKSGFHKEGVFRHDRWSGGRFHNTLFMSILAPEFVDLGGSGDVDCP